MIGGNDRLDLIIAKKPEIRANETLPEPIMRAKFLITRSSDKFYMLGPLGKHSKGIRFLSVVIDRFKNFTQGI